MKRNLGIIRNKTSVLNESKNKIQRKKTRFHVAHKQDESVNNSTPEFSEAMMTSTSINSSGEDPLFRQYYDNAKNKLKAISQIQKKISSQSKARLSSFKQKDNLKYDESISKLACQATSLLVQSQKYLKQMSSMETKNQNDKKLLSNMCMSLAQQIRESSRNLRQQQKQYFDTIRSYDKNTKNMAIQLSEQQRVIMQQMGCFQQMQQQKNDMQNKQIDELVKSINKLSGIYKQLNNLVIQQGSLVDRIDVNIQATLKHTQQAVVHLQAADQAASSSFADKLVKILAVMIIIMAIILGLKWAN